ncbi:MAG: tRNA preQ1(34) S-adenosylmethionine ribosyltransferase-isomerase QueA [Deltaproteobacteria bacterium]|nr:tRNA preQ1(34) S-adenosylmethionine ribosyltransferase-isomerase QueA [Deltaproteobacteria bacterium]MBI4794523.1 tRNA preQ1(34) S-adenosylmethionine ribosyltransferase-isomerase QueA [Deltaproteobacteria bacterium]
MNTSIEDYNYFLPPELVAQYPLRERDASRLLILNRANGEIRHASFRDLPRYLDPSDLLIINDTRVFPARLHGVKTSGGKIELLLHHLPEAEEGEAKEFGGGGQGPGARATYRGRLRQGQELIFGERLRAEVISLPQPGVAEVRFRSLNGSDPSQIVMEQGEVPLPPYIRRSPEEQDREGYQTVYASRMGAIACPTAGLHFTDAVMEDLARRGLETVSVTLHVGPGTFMPVRQEDYTKHRLEPEYFELSEAAAKRLNEARSRGQRLVAVGTTSVRVLEYCAGPEGFTPQTGWCDLFVFPGYTFQAVDRLLTNFHLPKSTLLLLVSAFAGRDLIMKAYEEAVKEKYRFYSYGDCMLIL